MVTNYRTKVTDVFLLIFCHRDCHRDSPNPLPFFYTTEGYRLRYMAFTLGMNIFGRREIIDLV